MKNSNDTIWNRTSTFRFVAQHLNYCATTVPYKRGGWFYELSKDTENLAPKMVKPWLYEGDVTAAARIIVTVHCLCTVIFYVNFGHNE